MANNNVRIFSAKMKQKIFLNTWINPFLGHFWSFLVILAQRKFFQKIRLWRTVPHWPLMPCWVWEMAMGPITKKLPDRKTDRMSDVPWFIGPFWREPGFLKHIRSIFWSLVSDRHKHTHHGIFESLFEISHHFPKQKVLSPRIIGKQNLYTWIASDTLVYLLDKT